MFVNLVVTPSSPSFPESRSGSLFIVTVTLGTFLCAKLLVSILRFMYVLDGYNQGVGKGALQK
jgi:hypothetical protein